MTAPVPDPREPKPCPRCGTVCVHDGWGHVHPNGIGIGSCAVPDPRFRDQLAEDVHQALYDLIVDHPMWIDGQGKGLDYTPEREIRIGDFLDAATEAVAARVQAAANQRAAEELEAEAAYDDAAPDEQYARGLFARRLRVRADNLRSAT